MRRAGTVDRTTQGLAIVRCIDDDPPRIGTTLVDEQLNDVGRVVDVFGPVVRPYLAVSPGDTIETASHLGKKLYVR